MRISTEFSQNFIVISITSRNTEEMFSISVKECCGRKRVQNKLHETAERGKLDIVIKKIFADISMNFKRP